MQLREVLGYHGKTCIVTGGASGMGEQVVRILGALGAIVHVVDIQEPQIPCASFTRCDLSDFAAVDRTAETLQARAPIHFLFPCAGLSPVAKGALYCMQVNYLGTRHFVECLLPALADGASIALIASDAALGWQKNLAQSLEMLAIADPEAALAWVMADPANRLRDGYTTSKEMLVVWVQHAAVALGHTRRIRLNAIGPCPTKTAFMDVQAPALPEGFLDAWPYPSLGRMATAEEQAWPLVLLACELNATVTGSFLYTDQGFASGVFTGAIDPRFMSGAQ